MPKPNVAPDAKQVVYLWGAGATQADITYLDAEKVNLLMRDSRVGYGIATRILEELPEEWRASFVADKGVDIEKLISLLAASNVTEYQELANTIRKLYFDDICRSLAKARILTDPTLAVGLLEMHKIEDFQTQEVLSGVVTTNHDGLLQLAMQTVHGAVNIGVPFKSDVISPAEPPTPPVLQLHGSFTWTFGLPISISVLSESSNYSPDTVWIPPAILKESKSYPFNKLAAIAYEVLSKHCDILRVVGSSLTQNDWNVLSLIFNAQRHRELTDASPFRIELIMDLPTCVSIERECSYLRKLIPINRLTDGDFAGYDDEDAITEDMRNPLFYWLKEKIQRHRRQGDFGTADLVPTLAEIVGDVP